MNETYGAVIIGGGITGLAAAYELMLQQTGRGRQVSCAMLEASPRLGGKVLTERVDGFVIEAGPDSFLTRKPAMLELCRELGLDEELVGVAHAPNYIVHRGKLLRFPKGMQLVAPTQLRPFLASPLLSPFGKARALMDWFQRPRATGADETLGNFLVRHFGPELTYSLAEPLLAGIHAGSVDELSLLATWPQLAQQEGRYGSLIRAARQGARQAARKRASAPGRQDAGQDLPTFVTLRSGLGTVIDVLRERLASAGVVLYTNAQATELTADGTLLACRLADGRTVSGRAVLLATPAYATGPLVNRLNPGLAQLMQAIPYASTATVALAYTDPTVAAQLNGNGVLVPPGEGLLMTACTWVSTKWPHTAPRGQALIRCYVGRRGDDRLEQSDDALVAGIRNELERVMGIRATPTLTRVFRWPLAFPQYRVGHLDRVRAMAAAARQTPGLFVAGAALDGLGLPDCVRQGRAAGRAMGDYLTGLA